ncbi:hypothetical protein WR25_21996 [Diploscapter pachys]|uniref:Uncharacterized protein n=1 Tax=Diploscapter pachys TaxID=2018661 RepID=A0A2A2L9J5_9BILA|nr:hypothetical protein WR25_21996 [Diploscapter pachys]
MPVGKPAAIVSNRRNFCQNCRIGFVAFIPIPVSMISAFNLLVCLRYIIAIHPNSSCAFYFPDFLEQAVYYAVCCRDSVQQLVVPAELQQTRRFCAKTSTGRLLTVLAQFEQPPVCRLEV